MSSPPTGTVTFLFTDIEGSTKLAQEHPDKWETLQQRHHAILREAIESNNGFVFQIIGDAFCAAFHKAGDALKAALKSQYDLQNGSWEEVVIGVRMGIHIGEAETDGIDYRGYLTLSLIQRIMSAGHGGQILLSNAVENLLRGQLPKDVTLRDMGEHKLKGVPLPVRVFQVVAPDLQKEFPVLRTLSVFPNNLPAQITSFVGREKELADVKKLLQDTHMLTLIGPGGTGKTRLCIQSASETMSNYSEGVWLVELASILDPLLVLRTTALAIGLRDEPQRPVIDMMCDYLREKKMLIVLDNCEHLVDACAQMANKMLQAAPNLRILASSREALGIAGEVTYRVPSLGLPDIQHLPSAEALSQYEAVKLFIDRATSAIPSFTVTNDNAPALAQICYRLDGIPLAIELAAAKIRVLSVEQIAKRLDDRFRLLTGGSRTALERHQTLRATIDWSYNLLPPAEQALFRRLSVFIGGWTLEAAESVCPDTSVKSDDVLDLLEHLINKSIVSKEEAQQETRYRVLETMRQYANEKLVESSESDTLRDRHLAYSLNLAETAAPHLFRAEQVEWLDRLEQEHDNLRAALEWALDADPNDTPESGLRLVNALHRFWEMRGYGPEGYSWFTRVLAASTQALRTVGRARALGHAGYFATYYGPGWKQELPLNAESLALCRELGDRAGLAYALIRKAVLNEYVNGRIEQPLLQEGLNLYRALGDTWGIAYALHMLGTSSVSVYDFSGAQVFYNESLKLHKEMGNMRGVMILLWNLGFLALDQGDLPAARVLFEECLSYARELTDKTSASGALEGLGQISLGQGDYEQAVKLAEESLTSAREVGDKAGIASSLSLLGRVARFQDNYGQAVKLQTESLSIARGTSNQFLMAWLLFCSGELARLQNNYASARAFDTEALIAAREVDFRSLIARVLEESAALSGAQAQARRAVTLYGAASALREVIHVVALPIERAEVDKNLALVRTQLDEATFNTAWAEGNTMTLEQAIDYALEESNE